MPELSSPSHVWIDCDAGVDDAQGLLLALADTAVRIVGISCVAGNVDIDKVIKNVARILKLCGRTDVPVYRGAAVPLISPFKDGVYFHGEDGLGDVPEVYPSAADVEVSTAPGIAAVKLLEAAEALAGRLTVVAIGPLTNVALTCHLDATFPSKVARLVVMGSSEAVGNITACSEFNFQWDPEAAHMVLRAFPRTTVISWDCSTRNTVPWELLKDWEALGTPKAVFLSAIMHQSRARAAKRGESQWVSCDPLAVAVALQPQLVLSSQDLYCEVEVCGTLTKGMSVYDFRPGSTKVPNVELIGTVDVQAYEQLLYRSLL